MEFKHLIFTLILSFEGLEAFLGTKKELISLNNLFTPNGPFFPNRPGRPQIQHGCSKGQIDKCITRGHCSITIREMASRIINPNFPKHDKCPQTYSHVIKTSNMTCGVRLDFHEMLLMASELDVFSCPIDSIVVLSSRGPTKPACGPLKNVQMNIPIVPGEDVEILITAQSKLYKWEIIVNQLSCEEIEKVDIYTQYSESCGKYSGQDEKENVLNPISSILDNEGKTLGFSFRNCKQDFFRCQLESIIDSAARKTKVQNKVINGVETGQNAFPFMAVIKKKGTLMCGCSIVSNKFVMTAAHCVPELARAGLRNLVVALGAHNIESSEDPNVQYFKIKTAAVHNNYKGVENDIALMELEDEIKFNKYISPVCLPSNKGNLYEDKTALLIGWGLMADQQRPSPTLQQAKMPIVTNNKCTETWVRLGGPQFFNLIKETNICAGGGAEATQMNGASCNGDSGGPLLVKEWTNDDYKWYQVGIVSFGPSGKCYYENEPVSVFTRTTHFTEFLQMAYVKIPEDRLSSSLPTFSICEF